MYVLYVEYILFSAFPFLTPPPLLVPLVLWTGLLLLPLLPDNLVVVNGAAVDTGVQMSRGYDLKPSIPRSGEAGSCGRLSVKVFEKPAH